MKNQLILHGHFYQPPRENPWTGTIPLQPSAKPYHDWNSRITSECYAANSASRYLRYDGRIDDIVNNYEFISFNFGPTLLKWLKNYAPNVYGRILEADRNSKAASGHGNALAQSYNHTILPLDDQEDARTQIIWGIEDFRFHFGRNPEGIWLPECGINSALVDLLAAEGIRFVILAPWQGSAIKPLESDLWEQLGDSHVPFHRSYLLSGNSSKLSAFFYESGIAGGISFNHYLRSAEGLYSRLLMKVKENEKGYLIHAATDGEIYGHHEPFGDMCLAALSKMVKEGEKLEFTNYGAYLEAFPPKWEVQLRNGEEDRGTSWSCFHGLSRWYKDCGCTTGSEENWNQQWRTPLREGVQLLSAALKQIRNRELSALGVKDPLELVRQYIHCLTGHKSAESLCGELGIPVEKEIINRMLTLLEGEKYRHYMCTSCGWFFADISGIEPVQNLRYALRAIELYSPFCDAVTLLQDFMENLSRAVSNLPDQRTGKDIIEDITSETLGDGLEPALFFHIRNLIHPEQSDEKEYGVYTLKEYSIDTGKEKSSSRMIITDTTTRAEHHCTVISVLKENEEVLLQVTEEKSGQIIIETDQLDQLPGDLRYALGELLITSSEKKYRTTSSEAFLETSRAMAWSRKLGIDISPTLKKSSEVSVNWKIQKLLPLPGASLSGERRKTLRQVLDFAVEHRLDFDRKDAGHRFTEYLANRFGEQEHAFGMEEAKEIADLYQLAGKASIKVCITIPQNILFSQLKLWRDKILQSASGKADRRDRKAIEPLVILADCFGIYCDDIKRSLRK
jgi:hypothetical protein